MKLLSNELKKQFEKYPLGSQDGKLGQAKVLAKFFNPTGAGTWLITEGSQLENGDYEMFGYCHLGYDDCAEIGYVLLSELQNLKLPLGLTVERDLYYPKEINLEDAIKREGFKAPEFLKTKEIEKEADELEI